MPAATWKRGNDDSNDSDSNPAASERKKKRRSRWGGDEKEKTFIPGMPTVLPANLTKDQEEAYLGNYTKLNFMLKVLIGKSHHNFVECTGMFV